MTRSLRSTFRRFGVEATGAVGTGAMVGFLLQADDHSGLWPMVAVAGTLALAAQVVVQVQRRRSSSLWERLGFPLAGIAGLAIGAIRPDPDWLLPSSVWLALGALAMASWVAILTADRILSGLPDSSPDAPPRFLRLSFGGYIGSYCLGLVIVSAVTALDAPVAGWVGLALVGVFLLAVLDSTRKSGWVQPA